METKANPLNLEQIANDVVHPVTQETIIKYKKSIDDPLLRETWMEAIAKELGRLAQRYKDTKGTNTIELMDLDEIANMHSKGRSCRVCTHCSGLSPTEKRQKQRANNGWGESHQLPRRTYNVHGWHQNIEMHAELRHIYT